MLGITTPVVFVFIIWIAVLSCSPTPNGDHSNRVFISEPFQNRFVDDGTLQIHDTQDVGFNNSHFPEDGIVFSELAEITVHNLNQSTQVDWNEMANFDSVLNFQNFVSPNINQVIYVAEYLYTNKKEAALLSLGSDDGIKVWLNRENIYSRNIWRGIKANNDLILLNLNKGWNTIIYKISQGDGGWGLYRKLQSPENLNDLLEENAFDIYNDLLESAILEEGETLHLKIDPRSLVDTIHTVTISINIDDKLPPTTHTYPANSIPTRLDVPENFNGQGTWTINIHSNDSLVFRESIPFYSSIFVDKWYEKIKVSSVVPEEWAKQYSFRKLYTKGDQASTRMKAEALKNLVNYQNGGQEIISGFNILGYFSQLDGTVQTYTLFHPNDRNEFPLVYVMHGEYTQDSDYWDGYEGASHALMSQRIAASIDNHVLLVMPHGRGIKNYLGEAQEELPLINDQLKELVEIKSSHILVWSRGAISLFELLKTIQIDLNTVGIISPFVPDSETEIQQIISYIKLNYPDLKWFIRHGLNDSDSPISRTRRFVELLRLNGYQVNYKEIPYSTHWNYIYDQEKEYYNYVNAQ